MEFGAIPVIPHLTPSPTKTTLEHKQNTPNTQKTRPNAHASAPPYSQQFIKCLLAVLAALPSLEVRAFLCECVRVYVCL